MGKFKSPNDNLQLILSKHRPTTLIDEIISGLQGDLSGSIMLPSEHCISVLSRRCLRLARFCVLPKQECSNFHVCIFIAKVFHVTLATSVD